MITVNKLASVFDDPRIAAVRPLIDSTAAGREVTAQLEQLPVRLAVLPNEMLEGMGMTAAYLPRFNTMILPAGLANGTSPRSRQFLATAVRHEGLHRIQNARPGGMPSSFDLAWTGAKAAAGAAVQGQRPAAAWREAITSRWIAIEGEAYLSDYRAARELGESIAGRPVLKEIPAIERSLDRPLATADVIPAVLSEPLYQRAAQGAQKRARISTAVRAIGTVAVGTGAGVAIARASGGE